MFVRQLEKGVYPSQTNESTTQGEQSNNQSRITYHFKTPDFANQISWYSSFVKIVEEAIDKQIVLNAIVHGSFGDNTTTPFSDLEVTLVLDDYCFLPSNNNDHAKQIRQWLRKSLYPFILMIDPLQHHGAFYIWDKLINHYNESILPLSVYKHSWSVRPQTISFYIQEQTDHSHNSLSSTLEALRHYQKVFFRYGMNPYSIKRMLSNIMLVPAFYYQQDGIMMSKAEAINQIKDDNSVAGEMMMKATTFRHEWKKPPTWLGQIRSIINQGFIPSSRWDILLMNLYQDRELCLQFQREILPLISDFCRSFESSSKS